MREWAAPGSDERKASLQEAMRKWADQASMREDKALGIARKSKQHDSEKVEMLAEQFWKTCI